MILDGTQVIVLSTQNVEYESKYKQGMDSFTFTTCPGEKPDGTIEPDCWFYTCRENMITNVEKEVLKLNGNHNYTVDKSRFLIKIRVENEKKLAKSIKVINLFESTYGFPLSRCYRTILKNGAGDAYDTTVKEIDKLVHIYYLVGSRKWVKSSYMLSLYFLLLRYIFHLSSNSVFTDKHIESMEAFEEFIKGGSGVNVNDWMYIKVSYPYWRKIFEHYRDLFGRFSIEHNWQAGFNKMSSEGTMRYEGIYRLCDKNHRSQSERVRKLFEKYVLNPPKAKGE